jgi:serine protease
MLDLPAIAHVGVQGWDMAEISSAILAGTVPRTSDLASLPARFALELRRGQDAVDTSTVVANALSDIGAVVSAQSALEHNVLVLELPGRTLEGAETAAAFSAAYALADEFDLAAAEPDLPTAFFPELESSPGVGGAVEESLGQIPGCWVGREDGLEADWALDKIRAPQAWEFSTLGGRPSRGAGIVIAQPDTGVTAHPELDGVDRTGGFDMLDNDPDPTDPLDGLNPGHGTGTASVVVSPASMVVVGSAPSARHMPIRAIESVVRVTQVTVARSIDWAVDHGASVITMSLGGIPSFSLHRALRRAVAADVIVLAAAGNCVRLVVWPARYDDCIAVAGTNASDGQWPGTSRGSDVDISAPGQNVFRATIPQGADQGQGTSFAVALTAGVAALWLAHHGRANLVAAAHARGETLQAMFLRLLKATARRPAQWNPFEMGPGIVDARGLLGADLDLGRDIESVQPPADPRAAAARSVESLVAEAVGPHAAVDDSLDLHKFGPELATAILSRSMATGQVEEEAVGATLSAELAGAVSNPGLRHWLGIDDGGVPE